MIRYFLFIWINFISWSLGKWVVRLTKRFLKRVGFSFSNLFSGCMRKILEIKGIQSWRKDKQMKNSNITVHLFYIKRNFDSVNSGLGSVFIELRFEGRSEYSKFLCLPSRLWKVNFSPLVLISLSHCLTRAWAGTDSTKPKTLLLTWSVWAKSFSFLIIIIRSCLHISNNLLQRMHYNYRFNLEIDKTWAGYVSWTAFDEGTKLIRFGIWEATLLLYQTWIVQKVFQRPMLTIRKCRWR